MKLNVNSNLYTFVFASIMVLVVAALLAFAATGLKTQQDANVNMEKKQNILMSLGMDISREEAESLYSEVIVEEIVIQNGNPLDGGILAFSINMADEIKKPVAERTLPLFVANYKGITSYIVPLRGKGLWGPIWGYVALKEDMSTVVGATFGHKSETPGLGAEISTPIFQDQFPGKEIMESGSFVSISVRKGDAQGKHQVDGISGGTITSVGVDDMLKDCLSGYITYFNSKKNLSIPVSSPPTESMADSTDAQTEIQTNVSLL